jgi:hypothetical protein
MGLAYACTKWNERLRTNDHGAHQMSFGSDTQPESLDRFELFAEQLALAADLLRAGGLARQRMALVAADNLAEILLYWHTQRTFAASEDSILARFPVSRYDRKARNALRQDFDRRLALAAIEPAGMAQLSYPTPVVDEEAARIFRIAHRYRNGVYHEDRHNAALLEPLTRLYLRAVGGAWSRAQPPSVRGGLRASTLNRLPFTARVSERGQLSFIGGAAQLANDLLSGLEVRAGTLAKRLASDLNERANLADLAWRDLADAGLPRDTHREMLLGAELRAEFASDPDLVHLQDESAQLLQDLITDDTDGDRLDELRKRYVENEAQQRTRLQQLRAGYRPKLNVRTPQSVRGAARRLEQLRDVPRLLERYEQWDLRLRLLERCLGWIDVEWDRFVSLQTDIARGK